MIMQQYNIFNEKLEDSVLINIYADEVISKEDPFTKDKWHYIGLIIEDLRFPLLENLKKLRYFNNFDEKSPFYEKNNKIIHWNELRSVDEKNIAERWLDYLLEPDRELWENVNNAKTIPSRKTIYFYILGLNNSKLNAEEFDTKNEFVSKYNRFFRSAILYAIKYFFPEMQIVIKNIFHEDGQQSQSKLFPWYTIFKLNDSSNNINVLSSEIQFLPKDHKENELSNIIQLCDLILGLSTSILHGIPESKSSNYREGLLQKYFPLFERLIKQPSNRNSSFKYYKRLAISFFPKEKTNIDSWERCKNQFYTKRPLFYEHQLSSQQTLF